jgi:hypothetical protein
LIYFYCEIATPGLPHGFALPRPSISAIIRAMEQAGKLPPDQPQVPDRSPRPYGTKIVLLSRSCLDGRSAAARKFDAIVSSVTHDRGGVEVLSQIEKGLIEAYAGASVLIDAMNAQVMMGEPVDLAKYSATVGAMCRIASRLGIRKRPKPETTLADYLASQQEAAE